MCGGVLAVEESSGLFEGKALRLEDEQIAVNALEGEPANVDDLWKWRDRQVSSTTSRGDGWSRKITYVVLPAEGTERNWVDILVEDESDGNSEIKDVETLSTEGVWQNFNGVRHDQRRERKTINQVFSTSG